MNRRKSPEFDLQKGCVRWLALQHPKCVFWANTIESKSSVITAAKHKAMGQKAGVPDLFIAEPSGYYCGLFIEFKSKTGRVRKEQQVMLDDLTERKYSCHVVRTFEHFMEIVTKYLN